MSTDYKLKKIHRLFKSSNATLIPVAGGAMQIPTINLTTNVSIGTSTAITTYHLSLTPTLWGTTFLKSGTPIISMIEGMLDIFKTIYRLKNSRDGWDIKRNNLVLALDFIIGSTLVYEGFRALHATTWHVALAIAAHGYAIKTGYLFIKELTNILSKKEKRFDKYNHYNSNDPRGTYHKLIVYGLEFIGYVCLSLGVPYFTAGFVCLALATIMKSAKVQNAIGSALCFFMPCGNKEKSENSSHHSQPKLFHY